MPFPDLTEETLTCEWTHSGDSRTSARSGGEQPKLQNPGGGLPFRQVFRFSQEEIISARRSRAVGNLKLPAAGTFQATPSSLSHSHTCRESPASRSLLRPICRVRPAPPAAGAKLRPGTSACRGGGKRSRWLPGRGLQLSLHQSIRMISGNTFYSIIDINIKALSFNPKKVSKVSSLA